MHSTRLLQLTAALLLAPALGFAGGAQPTGNTTQSYNYGFNYTDKAYQKAGGYENTAGFHSDMNKPGDTGPGYQGLTNADIANIQVQNRKAASTGNEFEDALKNARVPVGYAPSGRAETNGSNGIATGSVGLDEKLVDASRLARTGEAAAQATGISLFVEGILKQAFGGNANAAGKIIDEAKKMLGVAGLWKQERNTYDMGKRLLVRDWQGMLGKQTKSTGNPANGNASAGALANVKKGAGAAGSGGGAGSAGNGGNQAIQTVDDAKGEDFVGDNSLRGQLLTPELVEALTAKGIDAGDLVDKFLTGEMDGRSIVAAVGGKSEFTAEEEAKGDEIAGAILADRGADDIKDDAGSKSGRTADFVFGKKAPTDGGDALKNAMKLIDKSVKSGVAGEGSTDALKKRAFAGNGMGKPTKDELEGLLLILLRKKQEMTSATANLSYTLLSRGISTSLHGQNIFGQAHRNYRSFGKWRGGKERLAAR